MAFLSGNICFRRIEYIDPADGHPTGIQRDYQISVSNGPFVSRETEWWKRGWPENTNDRCELAQRRIARPRRTRLHIQNSGHWILQGINPPNGVLGANASLVSKLGENDGAVLATLPGTPNGPLVPAGSDGTPANFVVLGIAHAVRPPPVD